MHRQDGHADRRRHSSRRLATTRTARRRPRSCCGPGSTRRCRPGSRTRWTRPSLRPRPRRQIFRHMRRSTKSPTTSSASGCPSSSGRRRRPPSDLLICKGAVQNVLEVCSSVRTGSASVPLDDSARAAIDARFQAWSAEGFRVLALAIRHLSRQPRLWQGRRDGPRLRRVPALPRSAQSRSARRRLRHLAGAVSRVKMITGDNRYVAAHLASPVGLGTADRIMTGEQLSRMTKNALFGLAPEDRPVRRDRPQPEGAHRRGAAQARPCRRLSRRRHQRRACPARGRYRHLGRQRGRCRARGGRHDPAQARSRRAAARRRGRPQDLRQHDEIHFDHHKRQFRQHDQHGLRVAVPAVPAAAGQADPAQQPAVVDCPRWRSPATMSMPSRSARPDAGTSASSAAS